MCDLRDSRLRRDQHEAQIVFQFEQQAVAVAARPETLLEIAKSGETLRQHLRQMPPLIEEGLRGNQVAAIKGQASARLEAVLGYSHEPELIHRDNLVLL